MLGEVPSARRNLSTRPGSSSSVERLGMVSDMDPSWSGPRRLTIGRAAVKWPGELFLRPLGPGEEPVVEEGGEEEVGEGAGDEERAEWDLDVAQGDLGRGRFGGVGRGRARVTALPEEERDRDQGAEGGAEADREREGAPSEKAADEREQHR